MIEKFYQENKIKDIKIDSKDVLRIINQDKSVYPNVIKDGLVLHYDFRGYTNANINRDIAFDLSGNGNHGELKNFAFSEGSGYDGGGLVFDGVDDYVQLPTLGLDADDFTVMINDKIFSYRGEQVAQVIDDIIDVGNINLALGTYKKVENLLYTHAVYKIYKVMESTSTYSFAAQVWGSYQSEVSVRWYFQGSIPPNKPFLGNLELTDGVYRLKVYRLSSSTYYLFTNFIISLFLEPEVEREIGTTYKAKLEFGDEYTSYSPAPEDFTLETKQEPMFGNKIKTLQYWNRALTDEEILQMYNIYK